MNEETRCPTCGKPLQTDAPQGLCPDCLMKAALGTGAEVGPHTEAGDPPAGRGFVPPSPEELAPRFPDLEILSFLGRGGMGAVYKARQKHLDRIVALKILPPGLQSDPSFAGRFVREAQAMAKLHHPHIVTLFEFGQADGLFFFLMEFVDGMTLRELMSNGRIAPREALSIVPQICDALQYAHDHGVVHRDIKPENILVSRRGQVKIADFGVARLVGTRTEQGETEGPSRGSVTEAGRVIGTPMYMAPEQFSRPTEVDHRADIYALGVVFYQMLTGETPARPLEPPSRKVEVDVRLDEVVLRSLEREPERRFQQVSEVKSRVEQIRSGTDAAATARPAGAYGNIPPEGGRTGGAKVFAGYVVLAALLIAGVVALYHALEWFVLLAIPAVAHLWLWIASGGLRRLLSGSGGGPSNRSARRFWRAGALLSIICLALLAAVPRHPLLTVHGTVTDSQTGRPVRGATITLLGHESSSMTPRPMKEVQSDARGKYRMSIPRYADPRYVEPGPPGMFKGFVNYWLGNTRPTRRGLLFKASAESYQSARIFSGAAPAQRLDYRLTPGADTGPDDGYYEPSNGVAVSSVSNQATLASTVLTTAPITSIPPGVPLAPPIAPRERGSQENAVYVWCGDQTEPEAILPNGARLRLLAIGDRKQWWTPAGDPLPDNPEWNERRNGVRSDLIAIVSHLDSLTSPSVWYGPAGEKLDDFSIHAFGLYKQPGADWQLRLAVGAGAWTTREDAFLPPRPSVIRTGGVTCGIDSIEFQSTQPPANHVRFWIMQPWEVESALVAIGTTGREEAVGYTWGLTQSVQWPDRRWDVSGWARFDIARFQLRTRTRAWATFMGFAAAPRSGTASTSVPLSGQVSGARTSATHPVVRDESTTLSLLLRSGGTTQSREITVTTGQNAMNVIRRAHPASPAADDDPWIAFPAADGGNYRLFFLPADREEPNPTSDPLYAVIHYTSDRSDAGTFLLPKALAGRPCGDFRILRVPLDSATTRTALAALGMRPEDINTFFSPAADQAPDADTIVYDAADGGQYRLSFSPISGESQPGLTRIEFIPRSENSSWSQVLLSSGLHEDRTSGPVRSATVTQPPPAGSGLQFDVRTQAGEPIPAFRIIAGVRPGIDESSDVIANWQPHTLQGGENGLLNWNTHWTWDETIFRIEADGYQPAVTSWIRKSDGPKCLSITLAEDPGIRGRVLTPDAKGASSATLAMAMVQRDARLSGGRLSVSDASSTNPADLWRRPVLVTTDRDGHFRAPQMKDPSAAVLIVHQSGVRELTFSDFERAREITLQPWGQVEGQVQWKDTPGSSEPVELSVNRESFGYPGIIGQYEKTVTDARGRFRFNRVIPGKVQIARHYPVTTKHGTTYAILPGMVMHSEIRSGKATPVILGGYGRTVKGRITGCTSCPGTTVSLGFAAPHIGFPGDEVQWEARGQFGKSPIAGVFSPSARVDASGRFALRGVLPGSYQMYVNGSQMPRDVIVPPEQPGKEGEDLDLGDIFAGSPELPGADSARL